MRNFLRLCTGLDTGALVHSLACQPELWNKYTVRTQHPKSVHREADDIVLRYVPFDTGDDFIEKVCMGINALDYPPWHKLPTAHAFVFALMTRVQGTQLGRVMITRVPPGVSIPKHSDRIAEAEALFPGRVSFAVYYDRYHIVLQSGPGAEFQCGDESVYMAPGEAWWFNNQLEHSVTNNSAVDRLHLICDIRVAHDDYIPT